MTAVATPPPPPPQTPQARLTARYGRLRIGHPFLPGLGIALILVLIYVLVPGGRGRKGDPEAAFKARVEAQRQREAEDHAESLKQFQEWLARRAKTLDETDTLREAREQAEALAQQNLDLRKRLGAGETPFPSQTFHEEIRAHAHYATLRKTPPGESLGLTARADQRLASLTRTASPALPEPAPTAIQAADPPAEARDEGVLLRAGTWIPAILDHEVNAGVTQYARATIREDVYDASGNALVLPKGAVAILQGVHANPNGQRLAGLTVREILLPDGGTLSLPLPAHDATGLGGVRPDRINRHWWEKIGLSVLVATLGAAPQALLGNDLAAPYRLQVGETTAARVAGILEDALKIPDELTLNAGHPINLFLFETIRVKPFRPAFNRERIDVRKTRLLRDLEALKAVFPDWTGGQP